MQRHLTEEQLIELYYGDLEEAADAHAHLVQCQACGEDYRQLRAVLELVKEAPVPERGEGYGRDVWARLLPVLEEETAVDVDPGWSWGNWSFAHLFRGWNLAGVAAIAVLIVAAFLAGRLSLPHTVEQPPQQASKEKVREQVLLVALGSHLDRSQMVLMELEHAQAAGRVGRADISNEQHFAEDLIADNRLYRQTAAQVGETGYAGVLEDLERILLEIANSPSHLNEKQLEDLQKRIEDKEILFKVRVIGSAVREKEKSSSSVAAQGQGKLKL